MFRKVLVILVLVIIMFLLVFSAYTLLSKITIVEIQSDGEIGRIIVTCGSKLLILFNNSVTGSPVILIFEVCGDSFQGVGVVTDEATMEYYTAGVIDMNSSIRTFRSNTLKYCSSQEIRILARGREFSFRNVCVTLTVKPYIHLQP